MGGGVFPLVIQPRNATQETRYKLTMVKINPPQTRCRAVLKLFTASANPQAKLQTQVIATATTNAERPAGLTTARNDNKSSGGRIKSQSGIFSLKIFNGFIGTWLWSFLFQATQY